MTQIMHRSMLVEFQRWASSNGIDMPHGYEMFEHGDYCALFLERASSLGRWSVTRLGNGFSSPAATMKHYKSIIGDLAAYHSGAGSIIPIDTEALGLSKRPLVHSFEF